MNKRNQIGGVSVALLVAILMTLFFMGTAIFGAWAFMGRQDYKNNVDEKIEKAVADAEKETETAKEAEFAERDKSPTKLFRGAETFGSLRFNYPRTWSAYVANSGGATPLDATLHPDFVTNSKDTAFALRVQVIEKTYEKSTAEYDSAIEKGEVTASPYTPKQVSTVIGLRLTGEVVRDRSGVAVLLPLRDKTIKIWTESNEFVGDLDKFILESLTFQP